MGQQRRGMSMACGHDVASRHPLLSPMVTEFPWPLLTLIASISWQACEQLAFGKGKLRQQYTRARAS
jgi:hypothetical protein